MRRAFARILPLAAAALVYPGLIVGALQLRAAPQRACGASSLRQQLSHLSHALESRRLPGPRFGTNPDGRTWRLSNVKPGSELRDMDLRGCDWRGVDLEGVTLLDVDLRKADPRGANLRGARVCDGCAFYGIDLRGAEIDDLTDFLGARYDRRTRWPAGFDP